MEKQYKIPTVISATSVIMAIALLFDGQLGVGYWLYKVFPCEDV
jgi:hypothetical protein